MLVAFELCMRVLFLATWIDSDCPHLVAWRGRKRQEVEMYIWVHGSQQTHHHHNILSVSYDSGTFLKNIPLTQTIY